MQELYIIISCELPKQFLNQKTFDYEVLKLVCINCHYLGSSSFISYMTTTCCHFLPEVYFVPTCWVSDNTTFVGVEVY